MQELLAERQELLAKRTTNDEVWEELAEVEDKIVDRLVTRDCLSRDPQQEADIPGEAGSLLRYICAADPDVDDPEPILDELVSATQLSMAAGRERAREYYDNPNIADRVLQEIICRDDRITDEDTLAQLPLEDPEQDLSQLGQSRYGVEHKENVFVLYEEQCELAESVPPTVVWPEVRRFPIAKTNVDAAVHLLSNASEFTAE